MAAAVGIRPARPDDRPEIVRLVSALQEAERTMHASRLPAEGVVEALLDEQLGAVADARGRVLLAVEGGHVVGLVSVKVERLEPYLVDDYREVGWVTQLHVNGQARRRGIARLLMQAAEEHCRSLGLSRMMVCALAANGPARAAYADLGFAEYDVTYEKAIGD